MITILTTTLSIVLVATGAYLLNVLYHPKTFTLKNSYNLELSKNPDQVSFYEQLEKEDVYITSSDGYKLYAQYIPNKQNRKTIILSHGYAYNHHGSIKYLKIFYDMGYNALLVDHRFHGRSQGPSTSFGHYEKYDLSLWTDWLLDHTATDNEIGIHGESMGASSAIIYAAHDNRISFVIADCPFGDFKAQLKHRLKIDYKLPTFPLLYVASLLSYMHCGFLFSEISPLKALDNLSVPILFFHGSEDNYILPSHSELLFRAATGKKDFHIIQGAKHANSVRVDPIKYQKSVSDFLYNR